MYDLIQGVEFIKLAGKQQHAVEARVEGFELIFGAAFYFDFAQFGMPGSFGFGFDLVKSLRSNFTTQIQFGLLKRDKG